MRAPPARAALRTSGSSQLPGLPPVVVSAKKIRWLIVLFLMPLAVVLPGVASATLSSSAMLKVKSGDATFCLEPQAQQVLDATGIAMSADAPAQLLTNPVTIMP